MLITIVVFIAILGVIVVAHELGHFVTAKAFGVKVEEFGLGYPPRIFGIRRGETLYSLNAIPIGGFTKMAGEEDPAVSRSLASKKAGPKLLILSAGSIMNLLLPLLLFSIAFMVPHDVVIGQVVVNEVAENSPAAMAGIEPGDSILRMNNEPVHSTGTLIRYSQLNLGKEVTLLIRHTDDSTETVSLVPRWNPPPPEGAMGTTISMPDATVLSERLPFWKAIPTGFSECIDTFVLFKNEITKWIIGTTSPQIAGPVAIAQITGDFVRAGFSPLMEFAAILSINLAIVNLLPLPALDGGRIVFVLLGLIGRGKRISPRVEGLVHLTGFFLLIALMLVVTYQDIVRIISGGSVMP